MNPETPQTLQDYLNRHRKPVELRRTPAWIRRQQVGKLPNKDYTLGAFVPVGSERGA